MLSTIEANPSVCGRFFYMNLSCLFLFVALPVAANGQVLITSEVEGLHPTNGKIREYSIATGAKTGVIITTPAAVVVAESSDTIYTLGVASHAVSAYRISDGALLTSNYISVPSANGVLYSNHVLYLAGGTSVSTYNADTGAQINASFISGFTNTGIMALQGNDLYLAGTAGSTPVVSEYDAGTGALLNSNVAPGLIDPTPAITVSGNGLFVCLRPGNVAEYNSQTGALINSHFISTGQNEDVLAASGNYLFYANYEYVSSHIMEFNATNGAAITTLDAVLNDSFTSMAVAVPEPSAAALSLGILAFCGFIRVRNVKECDACGGVETHPHWD